MEPISKSMMAGCIAARTHRPLATDICPVCQGHAERKEKGSAATKPSHGLTGATARRDTSVLPARTWAKPWSQIVHTRAVKKQKIVKKQCRARARPLLLARCCGTTLTPPFSGPASLRPTESLPSNSSSGVETLLGTFGQIRKRHPLWVGPGQLGPAWPAERSGPICRAIPEGAATGGMTPRPGRCQRGNSL